MIMKQLKQFSIITLVSFTIGCSSNPPVETEKVRITIPDQFIPDCSIVSHSGGNTLNDDLNFLMNNYKEYRICQNQIDTLIQWNNKQEKLKTQEKD